jgi:hypothetical protein
MAVDMRSRAFGLKVAPPASASGVSSRPFIVSIFSLYFVMTTPSWAVASIPIFVIVPPLFCLYFLWASSFRVATLPLLFALALLIAATPGTIMEAANGSVKVSSLALYLVSLGMFVIYASTALQEQHAMESGSVRRSLEAIIMFILFFSVCEIVFPLPFTEIRKLVFGTTDTSYARDIREVFVLRPTVFFSEASHAGRFAGIVCAAYALSERFSVKSLLYFAATFILIRSPTELYVAPVFLVPFFSSAASRWRLSRFIALVVGTVVFVAISLFIFRTRLLHLGTEGSAAERFVLPVIYLVTRWSDPYFGFGLGGHEGLYRFVFFSVAATHPGMIKGLEVVAAPNSAVVTLGAIGVIGMLSFLFLSYFFMRSIGLLIALVFFSSAVLVTGYNAPLTLVPFAFLFFLTIYSVSPQNAMSRMAPDTKAGRGSRRG